MTSSAFYVAPHGLLSGLLWTVANVWATRAVQYFGIGNYYIWHELTNLFGTFVIGVFGPKIGIPARPPKIEWLAGLGFICVFLGMIPVVFLREEKAEDAEDATPANPTTATNSLETLFRPEIQEGSTASPSPAWNLPEVLQVTQGSVAAANALTWDGTMGRPDVEQLRRLRFPAGPLKLDTLCSGGLPIIAASILEEAAEAPAPSRAWLKGWLLSLVTGLVLSLQYEPMLPWQHDLEARGFKPSGVDYTFSNCLGIFLCSTTYLLIASGWKRLTRQPLQKPVLRPPLLAGVMWTMACSCQLYAMTQLPYAVAYCLVVGGGLAVSLLWGTLVFGEAAGLHNKKCLALAFLGVFLGLVLLGLAA
ncbi:tmem144A [Symbiodinium natans]|uniref:Tmem144A protein n=1 Tax=Symbiodinium natans TaxID=878477 RepID=A0A812KIV0_9DINO|nr:tmem144A [Symbiodinium natans]